VLLVCLFFKRRIRNDYRFVINKIAMGVLFGSFISFFLVIIIEEHFQMYNGEDEDTSKIER
jgi:hypothetical protein